MSKNTKNLGIIGFALLLASVVLSFILPVLGWLSAIAGIICVLISYINASNEYGEPIIKNNIIKAIIAYVIGLLIGIIGAIAGIGTFFMFGRKASTLSLTSFAGTALVIFLIIWITFIVAGYFFYKANILMGEKSGINLFKTGGLLVFIGAIGIIVFGIGGLVALVGYILLLIAFINVIPKEEAGT